MATTEAKCAELIKIAESANFLSKDSKEKIRYYLTDEDFANERFAMIDLVEIILQELL